MVKSKVKFGDKIFLYGQFMQVEQWEEYDFCNPIYNSVMGYIPIGGYGITPQESDILGACIPGFVVENLSGSSLAVKMPFANDELIEVTNKMSLVSPLPTGCKIWMPICKLPQN